MHEPAAPTSRATDSRLAGLDVIRATAMLLGVGYHASIAFIPGISRWYPAAAHTDSDALRVFSDTLHAFRMELFFMLAGFFAHLLVRQRLAVARDEQSAQFGFRRAQLGFGFFALGNVLYIRHTI